MNTVPLNLGGNRILQGIPDSLTTLAYTVPGIFQNLSGNLDGAGSATVQMAIPDNPLLVGLPITFNFITLDATLTEVVRVSDPYTGTVVL